MQKELNTNTLSNKRKIVNGIVLLLIPFTIYIAWKYFNRNYQISSLLIVLYTIIPFFAMFEKRKPEAREFITIAVMCAIAVGSRAAFIWVEHFKPMAAIIIITGIALGAEAGLFTAALSVLVSNMIFGHGPWTPWQMFAFGLAGYVAGMGYRFRFIDKANRVKVALWGGVIVMVFVGPLLDTASLFLMAAKLTKTYVIGTYKSGLPVNAIHALATMVTLYFFSQPLFEKLERLKMKYGMMEG